YVHLKGGDPAGKAVSVTFEDSTPDAAADHALGRLKGLAARFEDETTPYRALTLPMWKNRYGTYDDLARVKERSEGISDGGKASGRSSFPKLSAPCKSWRQIPMFRRSLRPMRVPARPTCWHNVSFGCCSPASIPRRSFASPSPRLPPPIWPSA